MQVRVTEIPDLPHTVTVDSLGYRGADIPRSPDVGELRVLFVGDSFVYGSYVEDDETYPARLEQELRVFCPSARVVNAGVGGTSIVTHANMIRRGLELSPDLVLLNFTENDVGDLAGESMWDQFARNRAAKSSFPLGVVYPILRNTSLWHLMLRARGVLSVRRAGVDMEPVQEVQNPGPPTDRRLRDLYARELMAVAAELRGQGIPFVSTAFPAHHTLYGTWSTEQLDWFGELSRTAGIHHLPILDVLRASGRPETELYLLPWDGHPSPLGYELAARTIAGGLRDSGLLRSCAIGT